MATPSTQLNLFVDLSLDNVPQEIEDPLVYNALLNIHNAIEALSVVSVNDAEGGFAVFLSRELNVAEKASDYNITLADKTILVDASANTVTISLPAASEVEGYDFIIKVIDDTFTVAVATVGADKLDDDTADFELILHETIVVRSDGTDYWIL